MPIQNSVCVLIFHHHADHIPNNTKNQVITMANAIKLQQKATNPQHIAEKGHQQA